MALMANAWAASSHHVALLTTASAATDFYPLDPRVTRVGLGISAPSRNKLSVLRYVIQVVRKLRAELRRQSPDVVVSFLETMNVLVLLAGTRLGVPIVVGERTDPRMHNLGIIWRVLRRITYPR